MSRRCFLRFAPLLILLSTSPDARAQAMPEQAFVLTMGADTLAVERYTVAPDRLEGEIVGHAFGRLIYEWTVGDHGVREMTLQAWRPGRLDGSPQQTVYLRMEGDSAIVDVTSAGSRTEQRFETRPGALPYLNPSMAQIEHMLGAFPPNAPDTSTSPLFLLQGGNTIDATIRRLAQDSIEVMIAGSSIYLTMRPDGAISSGTIPSQGILVHRDDVARFPASVLRPPDYSAPADAPYVAEEVLVSTRSGHTLAGTLTIPDLDGPFPAVVTITGSGPQDRDQAIPGIPGYRPFREVADILGRRGIAVLRLDDRGVGRSTGSFDGATSADFADDVRDAIEYLRGRADVDPGRIALVGHSEGGLIAPIVAATDNHLSGIVLIAGPAHPGRKIIDYQLRSSIDRDTLLTVAARDSLFDIQRAEIDTLARRNAWMRYFLDHDPLEVARAVTSVPVLIVHGETDRQVTLDQAEILADAFRAAGNTDVTVELFEDVNHLLLRDPDGSPSGYSRLIDRNVSPELLETLAGWIDAVFGAP